MSSTSVPYTLGPLLEKLSSVEDLRGLDPSALTEFCDEVRDYLIDLMAERGGYLGSNLGVIELSAALHYVYQTPRDRLLWDAGHQLLPHLIMTGRRKQLEDNPIIPYHSVEPNEYDAWYPGHASRSISVALGLADGFEQTDQDQKAVAIVGDAAIAAGLAFEAMNHAGGLNRDLLIILNDNNRSIDPNVGALNEYLAEITSSQTYNKLRDEIYDLLGHFRSAGTTMRKAAARLEKAVMAAVTPGSLFDALGLKYYGPIDGHNTQTLVRHLTDMRSVGGAKLLHVVTVKGKGFAPAEREPQSWKGKVAPFDRISGTSRPQKKPSGPSKERTREPVLYSKILADVLTELCDQGADIAGITPSVFDEAGLQHFAENYPERAYRMGLSEAHATTFAAGLAAAGKYPVLTMQASLLPRALDSILQDWCSTEMDGLISLDEAGFAHNKGGAYHSFNDLALLKTLPGVTIASPADARELRSIVHSAYEQGGIWIIRGSYDLTQIEPTRRDHSYIERGTMRILREGESILMFSLGSTEQLVSQTAQELQSENLFPGHIDARFVHPLNEKHLRKLAQRYNHWISIEEAHRDTGLGGTLGNWLADHQEFSVALHRYGVSSAINDAGNRQDLLRKHGFDAETLKAWILKRIQRKF